jgi:hypothetical protein
VLTSGSEAPLTGAAGKMLYRVICTGPADSRTSVTAPSGTMLPLPLRTLSRLTVAASARKAASAWIFTCQVRPKRRRARYASQLAVGCASDRACVMAKTLLSQPSETIAWSAAPP